MAVITIVGAGMMGSALAFPARENGHEVRLVGIHNRESIESIRRDLWHPTLKRTLPEGVKAYHLEELAEAMDGADVILCGVSSFGIEWFEETIVPLVPDGIPVLSAHVAPSDNNMPYIAAHLTAHCHPAMPIVEVAILYSDIF